MRSFHPLDILLLDKSVDHPSAKRQLSNVNKPLYKLLIGIASTIESKFKAMMGPNKKL